MQRFLFSLTVAAAFLIPSCSMIQAKKPVLKNTRWVCVQKMFVADAGTMTETFTLDFTSDKECVWKDAWVLPAHPAMYVNPDGTVDTVPARGSETVLRAEWRFHRNRLTLQFEDGSSKVFLYSDGHFTGPGPFGDALVFEKVAD